MVPEGDALSGADGRGVDVAGLAFGYGVLLFGDRVTAMALSGMLPIVAAGLSATRLRSRSGSPGVAAIADPPNTA